MTDVCKKHVSFGTWGRTRRCSRPVDRDGWCWQHHPDAVARRSEKAKARAEAERKRSAWYQLKQARDAHRKETDELKAELAFWKELALRYNRDLTEDAYKGESRD